MTCGPTPAGPTPATEPVDAAEGWRVALLAASALHAGFQVTVSTLVYPVLARVPGAAWAEDHARHSRRIVPLVGVVYLAALVAAGGVLLTGPNGFGWVALTATGVAMAVTAGLAAPLHGRLGAGHDRRLLAVLLVTDRARAVAAVVAVLASALALL